MNTRRNLIRRRRTNESRKVTLTLGQLKRLVRESRDGYLSFDDLDEDQLEELRGNYFSELVNDGKLDPAEGDVPDDITDEELRKEYSGTSFTCDDFFCSAGQCDEGIEVTDECGSEINERHLSGRKERRERKLKDKRRQYREGRFSKQLRDLDDLNN